MNLTALNSVSGLAELVSGPEYRAALGLPDEVTETYENLASGEYNQNFTFVHPICGEKLVLRVERGSQMRLENQIEYEYAGLRALEKTGRTPKAFYCDGSKSICSHGVLVEEFLTGVALDYKNSVHLSEAAHIFADIHSMPIAELSSQSVVSSKPQRADCGAQRTACGAPATEACSKWTGTKLLVATDAFSTMLDECKTMFSKYRNSSVSSSAVVKEVDRLIAEAETYVASNREQGHQSIINTEVNNTNFLMGDKGYLIDWEKPLIADPAQDIGHFLADTTTFWKTEFFFTPQQKEDFIDEYIDAIAGRFKDESLKSRCLKFASFTCLRGITWCAMASVEYATGEKELMDSVTQSKFAWYLDPDRLKEVKL